MASARHPASPGRYAKGIARRQQILDRAIEEFADRGVEASSMRVLSEAIGVSPAALSHYFASRDELLIEVYREHEGRPPHADDAASATSLMVESSIRNRETPGLVRLYATLTADALQESHGQTRAFIEQRFRALRDDLTKRITRDQDAGHIRADLAPSAIAALLIAASDGLQVQWLLDPPSVDTSAVLQTFERLLRPPG